MLDHLLANNKKKTRFDAALDYNFQSKDNKRVLSAFLAIEKEYKGTF